MGNAKHPAQGQARAAARNQPAARTFLGVGAVLFVITAIEFGIVYLKGMASVILFVLLLLSALKFILVANYFMHLKWDQKLLTWVFAVGVLLALVIVVAQRFVNMA
jgi:cytochrome c oxidase subunit 4